MSEDTPFYPEVKIFTYNGKTACISKYKIVHEGIEYVRNFRTDSARPPQNIKESHNKAISDIINSPERIASIIYYSKILADLK